MPKLPFDMDIAVQFEDWRREITDFDALARTAILQILETLESPTLGELSLAFVSDSDIQRLNRDYRHKDSPTNVLSFPDEGPAPLLGDIVLALETIKREAAEKAILHRGACVASHHTWLFTLTRL